MATEKNKGIKGDIIAIATENYTSARRKNINFLDSYCFLDETLDKFSSSIKSFPSLDANGMKDDFKKELAYPNEGFKSFESFYEPLKLKRKDFY